MTGTTKHSASVCYILASSGKKRRFVHVHAAQTQALGPTRLCNGRRSCPAPAPWPEELPAQQSTHKEEHRVGRGDWRTMKGRGAIARFRKVAYVRLDRISVPHGELGEPVRIAARDVLPGTARWRRLSFTVSS